MIKIFPAGVMGPGYLKDLHGRCADQVHPDGRRGPEQRLAVYPRGAAALGMGSALIDKKLMVAGDWDSLTDRARRLIGIIKEARGGL